MSAADKSPDRAQRIKEVVLAALGLPAEQRKAYIVAQCKNDVEMAVEVGELLAAHDKAGSFMSAPTAKQSTNDTGEKTETVCGSILDAESPDGGEQHPKIVAVDSNATAPESTEIGDGLERPGAIIGRYKLLQKVGEGGFGAVFVAEQREPVYRRVALKIIKLGMDTRQVIARFEAERQALALMDHPSIARVLDAGATDTGRPYFVMEYVKGAPITQFCDQNNLTIRERLALFSQVCLAVQHAHQKGVIHRDIKPGNVLVFEQDGRPQAKVIDFGIAKATDRQLTDKTLFTAHEAFIGTPQYMSPEQAAGSIDIDTRTDVYSLGVLLYELLTGVTPFDAKWLRSRALDEVKRIIREVEPQKPSTRVTAAGGAGILPAASGKVEKWEGEKGEPAGGDPSHIPTFPLSHNATGGNPKSSLDTIARLRNTEPARLPGLLRGDLDWIVMKALDKDRGRRYAAASDLAGDLQRHTAGEPVIAAPPSTWYRIRKFARKHRTGSFVAVALVLAALGTTCGMFWALWERQRANRQADRSQRVASTVEIFARAQAELTNAALARAASKSKERPVPAESDGTSVRELILRLDNGTLADSPDAELSMRMALIRAIASVSNDPNQPGGLMGPELEKAFALSDRWLGQHHPTTLELLSGLPEIFHQDANNLWDTDRLKKARSYYWMIDARKRERNPNEYPPGQIEQWASGVLEFSSEYGEKSWAATQALGEPDTFRYGDIGSAWTTKSAEMGEQHICLAFPRPVLATGVVIRETSGNGFIVQVDVLDVWDRMHSVWIDTDPSQQGKPVEFTARFGQTSYPVKGVKLYMDTDRFREWEEIDAVKLLGFPCDPSAVGLEAASKADLELRQAEKTEAEACLARLLAKPLTIDEAITSAFDDHSIPQIRRLVFLEIMRERMRSARAEVDEATAALIDEHITAIRVRAAAARMDLPACLRTTLMKWADGWVPSPGQLAELALTAAIDPAPKPERLAAAADAAEESLRVDPNDPHYLRALGAVQRRRGEYAAALDTLSRARSLNKDPGWDYSVSALIAMTQHELGRVEAAREELAKLSEALANPAIERGWARDARTKLLFEQARRLLEGSNRMPATTSAPTANR